MSAECTGAGVELEPAEKADAVRRPPHVRATTVNKRLLLTQEMLESIDYEDMDVLELLRSGSPLAGETNEALLSEAGFGKVFRTQNWVHRSKLFCR